MSERPREEVLAVQRMVADKVTDEMLLKPVKDLSDAEAAILAAAFRGAHGDEIMARMDALTAESPAPVPMRPEGAS